MSVRVAAMIRPSTWRLKKDAGRGLSTMVGSLRTPDPTLALHGATKQYTDARTASQARYDLNDVPFSNTAVNTNKWYPPNGQLFPVSGINVTRGKCTIWPMWVGTRGWEFDGLICRVATLGGAGSVVRMGIYALDRTNLFKPTSLLIDAGTVAATTTGVKSITFAPITIAVGTLWIGLAIQWEGTVPPALALLPGNGAGTGGYPPLFGVTGFPSTGLGVQQCALNHTGTVADGALPGASEFANFAPAAFTVTPLVKVRRTVVIPA